MDSEASARIGELNLRLTTVEKKLDLLFSHLGLHWEPQEEPYLAEARRLAAEGRLVEAIKHVREATGLGLVEAKTIVERL